MAGLLRDLRSDRRIQEEVALMDKHNISVRQYSSGPKLVCSNCDEDDNDGVIHEMGYFATSLADLQAAADRHLEDHK